MAHVIIYIYIHIQIGNTFLILYAHSLRAARVLFFFFAIQRVIYWRFVVKGNY